MNNARWRLFLANCLVVLVTVALFGGLGWASVHNFSYNWDWLASLRFFVRETDTGSWAPGLLLDGFFMTIRLTIWGGILCLFFGLLVGLLRVSKLAALRLLGTAFVELVRNTPPLVFMFIMYFFVSSQILPPDLIDAAGDLVEQWPVLSILFGRPAVLENFASGVLCIALYEAAYVAEIVRGGIQSIERSQWEAGEALGLHRGQVMRHIVLPQALRKIVPPTTNQLISLVKDSSIISVISVQELTFAGIEVATSTGRLFETLLLVSLLYFLLCWPISLLLRRSEINPKIAL